MIPKEQAILKDNIQWLFLTFSLNYLTKTPKYFPLIIIMFCFRYQKFDKFYFNEDYLSGNANLTPVEAQNFSDFE